MEEQVQVNIGNFITAVVSALSGAIGFLLIFAVVAMVFVVYMYLYSNDESESPKGTLKDSTRP